MAGRLRDLGRPAEIEPFSTWPGWLGAYALLAAAGIAACVVSVSQPVVGACMARRRLRAPDDRRRRGGRRGPPRLRPPLLAERGVAGAGHATRRAGARGPPRRGAHRPGPPARGAPADGSARAPAAPVRGTASAAGLDAGRGVPPAPCSAWWAWRATALTAVQFALAVLLLVALPLLVDAWLSPTVPGAGDNASGVAVVLRLADRLRNRARALRPACGAHRARRRAWPTGCARSCAGTAPISRAGAP